MFDASDYDFARRAMEPAREGYSYEGPSIRSWYSEDDLSPKLPIVAQAGHCRGSGEQTGASETAPIERLDQFEATASRWAEAEYQDAMETGRHGVKPWIAVMRPSQASI